MTFTHLGEQWLDQWMEANAFVCWIEHQSPWELERELLHNLSLPLNIMGNDGQSFPKHLGQLRRQAIEAARNSPIAREDNHRRRI